MQTTRPAALFTRNVLLATALLLTPIASGQGLKDLGPRFELDLDSYRTTDPDQVLYREADAMPLPIAAPRAIAAGPGGTIYAGGEKAAISLDMHGNERSRWTMPSPVTALAAGPDGRVYAGAAGAVYLLKPGDADPEPWTDLGERAVITSIAATSNRVFLADAGNRVVAVFDQEGKLLRFIGRKNKAKGIPGLIIPSPYFDVSLASGGDVWLANTGRLLVARFTEEGERREAWGEGGMNIEGFCGCCNPIHLAVLPDGRFATSEKSIPRVKVYAADGSFAGVVAGAESFHKEEDGLDLAVDARGRLLVLDSMKAVIRVYEPKGRGE